MADYAHKKFNNRPMEADRADGAYAHKKFGNCGNALKRKRIPSDDVVGGGPQHSQQEVLLSIPATIACSMAAKRHQARPLFRPWLDADSDPRTEEAQTSKADTGATTTTTVSFHMDERVAAQAWLLNCVPDYRPNMARPRPSSRRTAEDLVRRQRNNMACLLHRRTKQAEQKALQVTVQTQRAQHEDTVKETLRATLYLRQLLQMQAAQQAAATSPSAVMPRKMAPNSASHHHHHGSHFGQARQQGRLFVFRGNAGGGMAAK